MHLKSLTLKGFKSFASATTLRFEPGITAVVGPNGSGKSNVVDAIAWVLGEQGAKALRGGKMEDVIFAGTAGRAPLGRAEVTLTIDNTDGALPIAYAEVSITRRMFRDGASEYEINGETARLLDIQELLSDSGIGREMHVIVGQGQLDSVLSARPEDRRSFIEEAAGVLKHRKRKEKALRKLDAMQANLTRLTDLTGELRRQLKPLGKQAEVARRAAGVQAELRDSRLRLLADDLASLQDALAAEVADENAIRQRRQGVEQALGTATVTESELEQALAADAPAVAAAQEVYFGLSALAERFRGTRTLAAERLRHSREFAEEERRGRDPEELEAEAAELRDQERALAESLEQARQALQQAVADRQQGERELADAERALVAAARAAADRREGLAKLAGKVNALRSRASAGGDEIARLGAAASQARERAAAARSELEAASGEVGALDQGELDLDSRHEAALARHAETARRLTELTEQLRAAEQQRSTWSARRDALALGLTRKDGAGTLLADALPWPAGLGGRVAVGGIRLRGRRRRRAGSGRRRGRRRVDGRRRYRAAPAEVGGRRPGRLADRWRATIRRPARPTGRCQRRPLGAGRGDSRGQLRAAMTAVLDRVAVVDTLDEAERLVAERPGLRAVTRDGDLLGGTGRRRLGELLRARWRCRPHMPRPRPRLSRRLSSAADCRPSLPTGGVGNPNSRRRSNARSPRCTSQTPG